MRAEKIEPTLARLIEGYGDRLRAAREALDMSQAAFARSLDMEPTRYNHWEQNRHPPGPHYLALIKARHGIGADWILGGDYGALPPRARDRILQRKAPSPPPAIINGGPKLADRLRWLRQAGEFDIEDWAKLLGLTPTQWARYEAGDEKPSAEILQDAARKAELPLSFLTDGQTAELSDQFRAWLLEHHPEAWPDVPGTALGRPRRDRGAGSKDVRPKHRKVAEIA